MRKALTTDLPLLVNLMTEFYAEADFTLNQPHAARAFTALLTNDQLGRIWLIEAPGQPTAVGYLVLTYCYSMEYGGLKAFLDDLFVQVPHRNKGLSSAALAHLRTFCQETNIRAISVEVGPDNGSAQTVYRRTGFAPVAGRQWLTLPLASPAHQD